MKIKQNTFISTIVLILFLSNHNFSIAQVAINLDGSLPNTTAVLDLKSTDKGLLVPRMNTSEIADLYNPANGLLVFNNSDNRFYAYISSDSTWKGINYAAVTIDPNLLPCEEPVIYDGKTYEIIPIGNQCWMAENLNVGTKVDAIMNQSNNGSIEKHCYDNLESNCDIYGGLYQWNEMMNYSTTESVQGICPVGWHLPSDSEWKTLEMELGMTQVQVDSSGFRGSTQGSQLASNEPLWLNGALDGNGTGASPFGSTGFQALPGGFRKTAGTTTNINKNSIFWTSTSTNSNLSKVRNIVFLTKKIGRTNSQINGGKGVRCLRD